MLVKQSLSILFATDFSDGSKIALKTLKSLNSKFKIKVTLYNVIASYWGNWLNSGANEKEALQRLKEWKKKYSKTVNITKVDTSIGNPAENIVTAAERAKPDMIFLGGKVIGATERYKTSLVPESVVRYSKCSVWVCQKEKIKTIVCGIDGSKSSIKSFKFALALAKKFSAKLKIIHVLPTLSPEFGMTEKNIKTEEKKLKDKQIKKINKLIKVDGLPKSKYELLFKWGNASNVLLDYVDDYNTDLIVIGATGNSLLKSMLLGSTAERILRHSPCSLLIVR